MLRNYKEGKLITSFEEVYQYDAFIWRDKFYTAGWIRSWQVQLLYNAIYVHKNLYVAEKI